MARAQPLPSQKYRGQFPQSAPQTNVTGWPGYQQALKKSQGVPNIRPSQPMISAGKAAPGKATTQVGPKPQVAGRVIPMRSRRYSPVLQSQPIAKRKFQPAVPRQATARKSSISPVLSGRLTGRLSRGRQSYFPGRRSYALSAGVPGPAQSTPAPKPAAPGSANIVTGWPSNQAISLPQQATQPCDCSQCRSKAAAPISALKMGSNISPVHAPCPRCGSTTNGCTTLKGFALNSALLNPGHKLQLKQLAAKILQRNKNAVVATGYTNSSKTEQLVENLGERRAETVITELKRQLSKLRPGAAKQIFWKTISKSVTTPDITGTAGNRRVELCVRQLK